MLKGHSPKSQYQLGRLLSYSPPHPLILAGVVGIPPLVLAGCQPCWASLLPCSGPCAGPSCQARGSGGWQGPSSLEGHLTCALRQPPAPLLLPTPPRLPEARLAAMKYTFAEKPQTRQKVTRFLLCEELATTLVFSVALRAESVSVFGEGPCKLSGACHSLLPEGHLGRDLFHHMNLWKVPQTGGDWVNSYLIPNMGGANAAQPADQRWPGWTLGR